MIYLDTSYLVRLYFEDAGFAAARDLAASDHVACALHGQAEVIAAFHRKYRENAIPVRTYRALLAQFDADEKAGAVRWLPAGVDTSNRIKEVYRTLPPDVYLRAADALHLATAATQGFAVVYSHDGHLLAAAKHFGVQGKNILVP